MEAIYDKPPTEVGNRETMHEFLIAYGPVFVDFKNRYERGLVDIHEPDGSVRRVCGDPELAFYFRQAEKTINTMLENYFELMNQPLQEPQDGRGNK